MDESMKINEKNTALGLLDDMSPQAFRICEDAEHSPQQYKTALGLSIVREWPKIVDRFKNKIQYISDPFHSAYIEAQSKLVSVIDAEEIDESGTFISRSSPSETNTIFYDIRSEGKRENFKLTAVIFFFTKETTRDKPALAMYVQRNSKGIKSFFSETATNNDLDNMKVVSDIFTLLLFIKYCDLETKLIKPKSKELHIGTKYLNETNHKIEVLDSTWFTTIVRSDGFKVRGHFRLQAHGEGLQQRKLIWISDFEKSGYTRTAKVLNQ
jgi:hypothetical protein